MRSGFRTAGVFMAIALAAGSAFSIVRDQPWFDEVVHGPGTVDRADIVPSESTEVLSTAIVTRESATDTDELDATLSYVDRVEFVHRIDPETITVTSTQPATGQRGGTQTIATTELVPGTRAVTSLPLVGDTIPPGGVLYETDSTPVVLVEGEVAAYRTMTDGSSGADVEQLEHFLVEGGHDPDGLLTVDEEWTIETTAAVERWQDSLGVTPTGEVLLGDMWFVSDSIRVVEVLTTVGAQLTDGDTVLVYTSSDRRIEVSLDVLPEGLLDAPTVEVRLPDRSVVPGALTSVRGSGAGFDVVIDVDLDGVEVDELDEQPVTVIWTVQEFVDELTVPPEAITRIDAGTYVVDRLDGDAVVQTPVEVVGQAGRLVAVSGLDDGAVVMLP